MIPLLIPLSLRGVRYRPIGASALLRRNLWIYGLGGLIAPFIGIKLIDLVVHNLLGGVVPAESPGRRAAQHFDCRPRLCWPGLRQRAHLTRERWRASSAIACATCSRSARSSRWRGSTHSPSSADDEQSHEAEQRADFGERARLVGRGRGQFEAAGRVPARASRRWRVPITGWVSRRSPASAAARGCW